MHLQTFTDGVLVFTQEHIGDGRFIINSYNPATDAIVKLGEVYNKTGIFIDSYENYLIWLEGGSSSSQKSLILFDLEIGEKKLICNTAYEGSFRIEGDIIVWTDARGMFNKEKYKDDEMRIESRTQTYGYKISTGEEFMIDALPDKNSQVEGFSNNHCFYTDVDSNNIYCANLSNAPEEIDTKLIREIDSDILIGFRAFGNWVVWLEEVVSRKTSKIVGYSIEDNAVFEVVNEGTAAIPMKAFDDVLLYSEATKDGYVAKAAILSR